MKNIKQIIENISCRKDGKIKRIDFKKKVIYVLTIQLNELKQLSKRKIYFI